MAKKLAPGQLPKREIDKLEGIIGRIEHWQWKQPTGFRGSADINQVKSELIRIVARLRP